jgi:thiosulfate dehydrogenase [quinone] large subunit
MTRTGTYVLTAIAAVGYVLLVWFFTGNGMSWDQFKLEGGANPLLWQYDDPTEPDRIKVYALGTLWNYVLLALIVIAGLVQAARLPAAGVDVEPVADNTTPGQVDDPKGWKLLMGNTYVALLWLPLRFYIGMAWLASGEHKLKDDAWRTGEALRGYWTGAVGTAEQPGRAYYEWFQDFLQYMLDREWYTWFADLIAWGEFLVGAGLVVGALVGIAAFFGTFMNVSFLLAGSTSSNPVLFGLSILIVLGWKVAGFWGLDRWLLALLGTPWAPGALFARGSETPPRREIAPI